MPEYRLYFIEKDGHIVRPPEVLECQGDEQVLHAAKQRVDGHPVEIWQGTRIVAHLDPDQT